MLQKLLTKTSLMGSFCEVIRFFISLCVNSSNILKNTWVLSMAKCQAYDSIFQFDITDTSKMQKLGTLIAILNYYISNNLETGGKS